jgi:hypothetical protein
MDFDISKYYSINFRGIDITSINATIPGIIDNLVPQFAGLVTPGSSAYLLVQALIFMVLRIVVMILWLILMGTVFKFIFWIIYLIIKPKAKSKNGKKVGKGLVSRFGGLAVGTVHALLVVFLFSIALSGLTSIGSSLVEMLPETEPEVQETYLLVLNEEAATLQAQIPELEAYEEVFSFMASYRETFSGKISSFIKIGKDPADEYLFDELFSLKVRSHKVKLKSELQTALRAYALIVDNIEGEITIDSIASLDREILEDIFEEISKLKLIQIAVPIGVEYAYQSDLLNFLTEEEFAEAYEDLLEIDFSEEIKNLGNAFITGLELGLLNGENKLDFYLKLDGEKVEDLFTALGELKSVDTVAPIGLGFLLKQIKSNLEPLGIDSATLDLKDITWSSELANLGKIFNAFVALGISYENEKLTLSDITDDGINAFSIAVFNSKFLTNNNNALAKVIINILPDDYRSVLTIENFEKEDLSSLLSLAKIMADAGLLEDDLNVPTLLSEGNIDKIADAISKSKLLSANVSNLLKLLLDQMDLGFEISESSLEMNWYGEPGKTEIKALFTAARTLYDLGLSGDDFLTNLNPESIDDLTEKVTDSDVLMSNIGNMIDYLFVEGDFLGDLTIDTSSVADIDWKSDEGRAEFRNIMRAASTIVEANLHNNPEFETLSDGTEDVNEDGVVDEKDNLIGRLAESLSSSILIKNNLSNIISQAVPEQTGDLKIIIFDDPDDWTELEIESMLLSMKIITKKEKLPDDLFNLTDAELDIILSSLLVSRSIVQNLEEMTEPEGKLYGLIIIENVNEEDWYDRFDGEDRIYDGELRRLFNSGKILLGENPDFDDSNNLVSLNRILEIEDEEMDKLVQSTVLRDSIANKLIEKSEEDADLEVNLAMGDPSWTNEIKRLIKATKILLGDDADLDNINLDINTVKSLNDSDIDVVIASIIISDTIIKKLVDIGADAEGSLVVRYEKNDPAWHGSQENPGELKRFLTAVNILLDEDDDLNNPDVISIDRITELTEEELDTLGNSYLIVDTAVEHLEEMTEPEGSLHQTLYLPEITKDEYYGSTGEFKNFMLAIQHILKENTAPDEKLEDLKHISISSLTGDNQKIVLASRVVKETIIRNIEIEADKQAVIKIAPELKRDGPDYQEGIWDNELPNLLDAISIILGEDAILDEINVSANDFLALSDSEIEIILDSRIVSHTAAKTIEEKSKDDASLIKLPQDLDPKQPEYDESLWYGAEGELAKALKALRELEFSDFNSDIKITALFEEARGTTEEVILASRVVEASVINKIETEAALGGMLYGTLIIPEGVVWSKSDNDKGELRRFLLAIELVLGGEEFENATFKVEKFFGEDQETLLDSQIVEASVINKIETEAALGGMLYGTLIIPEGVVWSRTENDEGELRRFLLAIELVLDGGEFEYATFEVDKFLGEDQETLLASQIVEASAISYIRKSDKLIKPDPDDVATYYYFEDNVLVWDGEDGELRRFLNGIKTLLGTSTFADFEFKMDNLLNVDFVSALESRVLEATLTDMVMGLIDGGVLAGLIKEPDNGYQWYHHATSTDPLVGEIRSGEFKLDNNPDFSQYSDLSGFLKAIQAMNAAGLSYDNIDKDTIAEADSEELADAFCDYSRVIGGSIAKMLNYVLKDVVHPLKPEFDDEDINYQEKGKVILALETFKYFVKIQLGE